jgi:nicotinamidase-related amidase
MESSSFESKGFIATRRLAYAPDPERAVLVLVDIQERLVAAIPEASGVALVRNAATLAAAAREFGFPVLASEQYPRGLGPTVAALKEALPDVEPVVKLVFNGCSVPEFSDRLAATQARDVILCGIEAHVCVLQTAFGLLEGGYRVFVAADACASRTKDNWKASLHLMREAGMTVGTTEIFLFGMLKAAGTDRFKKLTQMVK